MNLYDLEVCILSLLKTIMGLLICQYASCPYNLSGGFILYSGIVKTFEV